MCTARQAKADGRSPCAARASPISQNYLANLLSPRLRPSTPKPHTRGRRPFVFSHTRSVLIQDRRLIWIVSAAHTPDIHLPQRTLAIPWTTPFTTAPRSSRTAINAFTCASPLHRTRLDNLARPVGLLPPSLPSAPSSNTAHDTPHTFRP